MANATDREFAEKLVSEVKSRPSLYNLHDPGYKDRFIVESDWRDVAAALGVKACEAKKRWQNLRGSFSKTRALKSLKNEGKYYFYLYEAMNFLEPYMQNLVRPSTSTSQTADVDSTEPEVKTLVDGSNSHIPNQSSVSSPAEFAPETCPLSQDQQQTQQKKQQHQHHHQKPKPQPQITSETIPGKSRKRKFSSVPHDRDDECTEVAIKFLKSKIETANMELEAANSRNTDLDSLKGFLPLLKLLTERRKRQFLRQTYNLLFNMVDEQEDSKEAAQETINVYIN